MYNTWVRKPFSRVENDKPNYACFDIKGADKVYTLMFKYGSEADYAADILPVAESFAAAEVTASAPEIRFDGDGPALDSGARKAYNEIFGEKSPLTWGVFVPDINKPGKARALEEQVDFDFDIYLLYSGLNLTADGKPSLFGERLSDILTRTCPKGKIPELTLQTFAYEDKPGLMIYDVLNGDCSTITQRTSPLSRGRCCCGPATK